MRYSFLFGVSISLKYKIMEKYTTYIDEYDKITIQEAEYIEDGWFIEIEGNKITLFEIPLSGGEPKKIGEYKTLIEAIHKTYTLN